MNADKYDIKLAYRRSSRKNSYTKADWERLVLPVLEEHGAVVTHESAMHGVRTYQVMVTPEARKTLKKQLGVACKRLSASAGFGMTPAETEENDNG